MKTFEDLYMDEYSLHQHADIPMAQAASVGVVAKKPTDEMRAIEPSKLENALSTAGIGLEQAGKFLESLGSIDVGGVELSLRDLMPLVGYSEDGQVQGTPRLLQKMGRGESVTSGKGLTAGIKESDTGDVLSTAFDVATMGAPKLVAGTAKAVMRSIPKFAAGTAKAVARMKNKKLSRSILKSGETPAALEGK
jgi:hypothetical protein